LDDRLRCGRAAVATHAHLAIRRRLKESAFCPMEISVPGAASALRPTGRAHSLRSGISPTFVSKGRESFCTRGVETFDTPPRGLGSNRIVVSADC
jgi:hypothetical protein